MDKPNLIDFSRCDLMNSNLSGTDLSQCSFLKANLSEADLYGTNLVGVNLSEANLRNTDLSNSDLSSARLKGADLTGANLTESNLNGADLSDAILIGTNFKDADLVDVNLSGAYFLGCRLDEGKLEHHDCISIKLSDGDLFGINLNCISLKNANLKGVNLIELTLEGRESTSIIHTVNGEKTNKDITNSKRVEPSRQFESISWTTFKPILEMIREERIKDMTRYDFWCKSMGMDCYTYVLFERNEIWTPSLRFLHMFCEKTNILLSAFFDLAEYYDEVKDLDTVDPIVIELLLGDEFKK